MDKVEMKKTLETLTWQKFIDDFSFMGLSNIDFITTGFYKEGFKDIPTQDGKGK